MPFVSLATSVRHHAFWAACWLAWLGWPEAGLSQRIFIGPRQLPQMSRNLQLREASNSTLAHLERADQFLNAKQWNEAVETIRRVLETEGGQVIRAEGRPKDEFARFVTVRNYCQMLLVRLHTRAPEALELYRSRVDGLAQRWLRQGTLRRDTNTLRRVVDQMFASRFGDDALLQLGELALEEGHWERAREYWEQISPRLRVPVDQPQVFEVSAGGPLWLGLASWNFSERGEQLRSAFEQETPPPNRLVYPDTDLDEAAIRARLTLVSILQGDRGRAEVELSLLKLLHPDAEGRIAGRSGRYGQVLSELHEQSAKWTTRAVEQDGGQFAGSTTRNRVVESAPDIAGRPLWTAPLTRITARGEEIGFGRERVAESSDALLSVHPAVVGDHIYIPQSKSVRAYHIRTGAPAFDRKRAGMTDEQLHEAAVVFRHTERFRTPDSGPTDAGVARYTLSSTGRYLFARVGSPSTGERRLQGDALRKEEQGVIVGLNLDAQGKLLPGFPLRPDDLTWAFEGPPISDGARLFVAMRRRDDVRVQSFVACFDLRTGERLWRTLIAAAETPGQGQWSEITHNLLSMSEGVLYFNTNLGAVAAVESADGAVRWITSYPRAEFRPRNPDRSDQHFQRDLNPCLIQDGLVITAPGDCNRLFALDQIDGRLMWAAPTDTAVDAMHLLGAQSGRLIVSGDSLYWFDLHRGRLLCRFPPNIKTSDGHARPKPRGFGRGVIAGGKIFYPTRERILVFRLQPLRSDRGWTPAMDRAPIELKPRGATGGNLLAAGGLLFIASPDRLLAFDAYGQRGAGEGQ